MQQADNTATTAPATTDAQASNVRFIEVEGFKHTLGISHMSVVRNPKGENKLFVSATMTDGTTTNFRCQQDIKKEQAMRFLIEDGDYGNACLVNVTESENALFSL